MSASVSGQRRRRRRRRRRPVLRQREWPCSRPIGSAYSRSPQQRRCDGVKVKDIHPFIRLAGWLAGREGEAAVVGGAFAGLSLRALCALPKSRRPKASAPAAYWPRELVQPSRLLSAGASAAGPGSWLLAPWRSPCPKPPTPPQLLAPPPPAKPTPPTTRRSRRRLRQPEWAAKGELGSARPPARLICARSKPGALTST